MGELLKSATKIVFIVISVGVVLGFWFGRLEAKDFMVLASMVFSFYFSYKSDNLQGLPYNGK